MRIDRDNDFEHAVAHDGQLALRRALATGGVDGAIRRLCEILFHYEQYCDQCTKRVWSPHLSAGRAFCRRCGPVSAATTIQQENHYEPNGSTQSGCWHGPAASNA